MKIMACVTELYGNNAGKVNLKIMVKNGKWVLTFVVREFTYLFTQTRKKTSTGHDQNQLCNTQRQSQVKDSLHIKTILLATLCSVLSHSGYMHPGFLLLGRTVKHISLVAFHSWPSHFFQPNLNHRGGRQMLLLSSALQSAANSHNWTTKKGQTVALNPGPASGFITSKCSPLLWCFHQPAPFHAFPRR